MKSIQWLLSALVALAALAACSDDTGSAALCGPGEDITVDAQPLCVAEQAVVIETGFTCPPIRPERYSIDNFVCCGRVAGLSDSLLRRAIVIYKQRRGLSLGESDTGLDAAADAGADAPALPDAGFDALPFDTGTDGDTGNMSCDEPAATDNDGDGWCGPTDCDDRDPNNYPGNIERCDGVENNCDTNTDTEGSLGCVTYYYDSDNDTWGTTAGPCLCGPNGNYRATRGGDCFDGSNQVFPSQPLYFTSPRIDGSWDYNCDSTGDPQYPSAAQTCQVTPTTCATSASAGWRDGVPACGTAAPWVETCFFDDTGNPDTSGCRWNTTESRVQPCR